LRKRVLSALSALSALGVFITVATTAGAPAPAAADYAMPTTAQIFQGQAQSLRVIDGDVLGFDAEGRARVAVRAVLLDGTSHDTSHSADSAPAAEAFIEVMGVVYSCFGGSIQIHGVQAGRRYVLVLLGERLMEEQSYFPVTLEDEAPHATLSPHYAKWLGLADGSAPLTVPVASLRAHLATLP
jgi:hypothetical protein